MTGAFARTATTLAEALVWYHFVPASGPEGRAWYEAYRRSGGEALAQQIDVSVDLMRQRKLEDGMLLLEGCLDRLAAPALRPPAIAGVLEESYHGALAYLHYHRGEHAAARAALARAAQLIADVIAEAPCLITFATKCYDFCLHRARIARGERAWPAMWSAIAEGRAMLRGERPLCSACYIGDAEAFLRAIAPSDDFERRALALLCDREALLATYTKRALGASMPPGVVIEY